MTETQSLFDFIKHVVANFSRFLAPFLLMLISLGFQDTKICLFFPISENIWPYIWKYGKKHENPRGNLAQCYRLCVVYIFIRQDQISFSHQKALSYGSP